jgi:UDP-N-acetylmuramate: L-alanyl-gamma-D-glutamyl-meso-diaminopimelate ligase
MPCAVFAEMNIYFLGICGTAMGNAAILLRGLGHIVWGSDVSIYPPMSTVLEQAGIEILQGFEVQPLRDRRPDLIVVGNAVSRGNPVVEWLLEHPELRRVSLPELLSDFVLNRRSNIVVTGTHGKTTTSSLTAFLLREQGKCPGWFIGGVPRDLPCGAENGQLEDPFVIEGDEYDSAFFDKRSKFIHYCPRIVIANNLEMDHADIFRDEIDIQRTFSHLFRLIPASGFLLVNGDDPLLMALLPVSWTQVITVGVGAHNDLQIVEYQEDSTSTQFSLRWKGDPWCPKITWSLSGIFNVRNVAMAALATSLSLSPLLPPKPIQLSGLAHFKGVRRRQELLLNTAQVKIIEDFGHHPTAIRQTLEGLRLRYPNVSLVAALEPRSNTACTNRFQSAFIEALAIADDVYLAPVHRASRMDPSLRLDTVAMVDALQAREIRAMATASFESLQDALTERLLSNHPNGTVLCCFSNGAFGGILSKLVEATCSALPDHR